MIELRRIYPKKLNMADTALLTVIIPVRAMGSRRITERMNFSIQDDFLDRSKVEFLVVDDGSDEMSSKSILEVCEQNDLNYIYLDTNKMPFSIARARNIGAMYAKSEYIMFMDVDLYPYNGFYNELLNEIKIQNLNKYCNDFIMVGVIYLTQEDGNNLFFNTPKDIRKNTIIQKLLENDLNYIEKFSTGTSVNLYNRFSYLSHGGNDEDFEEWGYDDLEFNLRMIRSSHKFPYPADMHLDFKNFRTINEYKGWKSIYRLFGDITFQKGIVLTHIWHEIDQKSDYMQGKKRNQKLFEQKVKNFKMKGIEPKVLPSMNLGKTLIFSKTNPFIYNKKILPYLGIIQYEAEEIFDEQSILKYIKYNSINRVLMFNPYASEDRLKLYQTLKQANIPIIVAERGALRDSVFYDWNGFNAESSSYKPQYWDKELSSEAYKIVDEYIKIERTLEISLEKQPNLIGASNLRNKLNIPIDKKILFVPLQRPSDSVIKYFCGPINSYANFLFLLQDTIKKLNNEWVVVIKKHPLEDEINMFEGAIYSDANIKDLLEMADSIFLINSGVGLLSMLWNKPVYYCGDVFYGDDRINRQVTSSDQLIELLYNNFTIDKETTYRFLYYLLEEFYSFGKFKTKEIPWEGGGRMTVTTEIDFYKIRNLSKSRGNYYIDSKRRIGKDSILFDRYNQKIVTKTTVVEKEKIVEKALQQNLESLKEDNRIKKKFQKFQKSPRTFVQDSKNPILHLVSKIFYR